MRYARMSWLGGLALAAWSGPALAGTVTLTPLVPLGASEKQIAGLKQLMASELEFQPTVADVAEGPAAPAQSCLTSASCIAGFAQGSDLVLTGSAQLAGSTFNLNLVLVDAKAKKIVRAKTYSVPTDTTSLANMMTPLITEVITGNPPKSAQDSAVAAAAPIAAGGGDDDFSFAPGSSATPAAGGAASESIESLSLDQIEDLDTPPPPPADPKKAAAEKAAAEAASLAAAEAAKKAAADEAARQQAAAAETARQAAAAEAARQQAAAAEAARQQAAAAEAARQAAAAEAAKQAAAAAAAKQAAPPQPAPDVDAAAINFGSSVDQMSSEQIDQMIHFGPAPSSAPTAAPAPPPAPAPAPPPTLPRYTEDDAAADAPAEVEAPAPKAAKAAAPKSDSPTRDHATIDRDVAENLQITLRGGYALYGSLGFVAGGGELAVPVYKGLHVLAGVQMWGLQRDLPVDVAQQLQKLREWESIYPINIGVMYKFPLGIAQPYVGADAIFAQYYNDTVSTDWAAGGRLRGGSDFMIVKNFGLNVNIALGGWTGKRWTEIDTGLKNSGFLPEFSAGTVFAF